MKITVINGSPKGEYSITLHSARYIEKHFPQHEFTYVNVGTRLVMSDPEFEAACEKLRGTKLSVARIAILCGFSSANRLTHVFTARYGLSPRAYRASAAPDSGMRSRAPSAESAAASGRDG